MKKYCSVLWTFSHVINIILRSMIKGGWYRYQSWQTNTVVMFFQYYICKFPLFSIKYMIKVNNCILLTVLTNVLNCIRVIPFACTIAEIFISIYQIRSRVRGTKLVSSLVFKVNFRNISAISLHDRNKTTYDYIMLNRERTYEERYLYPLTVSNHRLINKVLN